MNPDINCEFYEYKKIQEKVVILYYDEQHKLNVSKNICLEMHSLSPTCAVFLTIKFLLNRRGLSQDFIKVKFFTLLFSAKSLSLIIALLIKKEEEKNIK